MALVKICDNCHNKLGGDKPFVQNQGSTSDQLEKSPGKVSFRYLTNKKDDIHTFCNDECEMEWREEQRATRGFTTRP